jgi:hypothetical protein
MQEQEMLLAAYEEANRDAAHQVKALENKLKEREEGMLEERRTLEREVVRAVEAQQQKTADTAHKLRYASDVAPPLPCPPGGPCMHAVQHAMLINRK